MFLFKIDLLILLLIISSIATVKCQSNDTEITTESLSIENESSGSEESEEAENANNSQPKDQSSSLSSAKPADEEVRTQPSIIDDNINDDNSNINKEENNEFTNNANSGSNSDDDLFSISPGASTSTVSHRSDSENKSDASSTTNSATNYDSSSSSPPLQTTEKSKNKLSYEDCVALGNENCGTAPEDSLDASDDDDGLKKLKNKPTKESNKPSATNKSSEDFKNGDNNQINSDQNKSTEPQEQKSKHNWYDEIPLKLGLPFILLLFVLFVIIFLLFLIFLIQDSISRRSESESNKETIKIKTGYGTQKFNFNQLQMLEKRMKAAREDVDLREVNVQSLNDKKDDQTDDQNNNVPNEFENIALQDKSSSSIRM